MARFIRQPLPPPLPLRFLSKEDIERLLEQARRERQVPPPAPPPPPPPSGEFPTELFRRQQTGQPGPQPAPPPSMVAQDIAELERLYGPEAVREFGEVAARGLFIPVKAVGTVGLKAALAPTLLIPPSQRTPELQRAAEFAAAGPRESWQRYEEQPWAAQMIAETPAFFPGKSVRMVSQLGKLAAKEVPKVAREAVPVVQRGLAGEAGFVRIPGGKPPRLALQQVPDEVIANFRERYLKAKTIATKRKIERELLEAHGLEKVPIGSGFGQTLGKGVKARLVAAPQGQVDELLGRLRSEVPPAAPEAVAPGVRYTSFERGAPPANPQEMYNWARGVLQTDELSRRLTQATTAPRLTPKNRAAALKIIREAEKTHPEWKQAYETAPLPRPAEAVAPGVAKEPWQMTKTVWEEENAVEAPSSYLYHGTPRKNLEKIRREGLQSKTRQRNDWEEGDRTPKMQELLYFERKPNKGWGGKGAVQLRVNEDMLPKGVDIKEDVLRSGEYYTYSFKNDYYEIPPEAIEYLEEKTGKWISLIDDPHKAAVRLALAKGKPVPAEVLADYPGLVARVPGTAPPVPPAAPEVARLAETAPIPVAMMEQLSNPEVARKAVAEIENKLRALSDRGFNVELTKRDYIDDLIRLGVEERFARALVNAAGERVKPMIPKPAAAPAKIPPAAPPAPRQPIEAVQPPVEPGVAPPVKPIPFRPEVTAADRALIEEIRDALVQTDKLDEVIVILPDGTSLTGREFKGIGAFQHLGENLPPVQDWLDAGVLRTALEADGTFLVEIRGGISREQFTSINKLMAEAKRVLVDFSYFRDAHVTSFEGTPNVVRGQLRKLILPKAVQPPVEPGVAPPVPGRAEAPPAPPSAGEAMPPPAVRAEGPPTIPPAEPPIKPPVGEGRPPVEPPLDPKEIVKEWTGQIKAAKKLRGPTAEAISKERARRKAIIEAQLQRKRGPEARRAAFGAAKGEIPTPMFEPASAVFSGEKAELLQEMIRAHFEKDAYRYLPAQTAFDKLFLGGRIPTPSELAVLEEVFGSDLIRAVLSQRAAGTKAWELFLEMWNVPKALKASFDFSGTLRQGAYLLLEGNPAKKALIAELKAVRSEAGFKAVNEAIASNKWYEFSQSLGRNSLDLTLPRVARGIVGREEPYIGARLAQRIPLIGKGVRISERAYTAFLNKIRMESFAREAEILSAKGAPRETFEKLAWNINVMSGRGPLGRFTQASAILNLPFFSPRFAVSRFQLPLTLATRNPQLLKMALRDVVGYISSVFALEALLDMAGVAEIEWNPLSSDFGKIRIGKTRIDPFAGFQQPVVLVAQLLAGKRKRLESGRMIEIDPTQRVGQFVESKLGPSASLNLALRRGKLFGGKELTPVNALYELLMPIPITDIWEAAIGGSGGLADSIMEGGGYGALGTLGMGIQTFGIGVDWSKELKPYLDIPSNPVELLVENQKRAERGEKPLPTRAKYREDNSEADAKLFILGETTAFETKDARQEAERLIVENKIDPRQIKGIKARIETLEEYEALNREYRARRQPTKAPPKNVQVDALLKSLGVYPSHVPAPSPRLPLSPIPTPGFQPLKPISPIPTPGFQPLKPMTREEAEELLRSLQTPVPAGVR